MELTAVKNQNDIILFNSQKGSSDRYFIHNGFILAYNEGLDYAGIEYFDFNNGVQYSYFFNQNMSYEMADFWEQETDLQKLHYLLNLIPWTVQESPNKPIVIN